MMGPSRMKVSDVRISESDRGRRYGEVGDDKREGFRDKNFGEIRGNTKVSERVASWKIDREGRG
jgi:hypothetical protein